MDSAHAWSAARCSRAAPEALYLQKLSYLQKHVSNTLQMVLRLAGRHANPVTIAVEHFPAHSQQKDRSDMSFMSERRNFWWPQTDKDLYDLPMYMLDKSKVLMARLFCRFEIEISFLSVVVGATQRDSYKPYVCLCMFMSFSIFFKKCLVVKPKRHAFCNWTCLLCVFLRRPSNIIQLPIGGHYRVCAVFEAASSPI